MSKPTTYRNVILPGVGRVKVPEGISDEQVLAQINAPDDEATPAKKTHKKP
tara:strand:- start:944 stop:1096 length:153 start_codon:yes stop_codon:yes gene_type:complete